MDALDKTAWEILNVTADDWENLEQIYRQICFGFSPDGDGPGNAGSGFYRPIPMAPLLGEVAERIRCLVEAGLLTVKVDENDPLPQDPGDLSNVWRGWFSMTPEGRKIWAAPKHAGFVEQE
jgi:hypothetical protein